jgi:hypothetical protein
MVAVMLRKHIVQQEQESIYIIMLLLIISISGDLFFHSSFHERWCSFIDTSSSASGKAGSQFIPPLLNDLETFLVEQFSLLFLFFVELLGWLCSFSHC